MTGLVLRSTGVALSPGRHRRLPLSWGWGVACLGAALVLSAAAAIVPLVAVATLVALPLVVVIVLRPVAIAYLLFGLTPLLCGIDRGSLLPLLRPNEALLLLALAGLGVRWVLLRSGVPLPAVAGGRQRSWGPVEASLAAMALAASIPPVLWMLARGQTPAQDDVLYAVTLAKYLVLYLVVRATVWTEREARRCLCVALAASAVVALIAVLQSMQLAGVPGLLSRYYTGGDDTSLSNGRGSSTFASPIAVGDVMAICLAMTLAWRARASESGVRRPGVLNAAAAVFGVGALASGQFSGFIALGIALGATAYLVRRGRVLLTRALPLIAGAAVLLEPVLAKRFEGFQGGHLPQSWQVRLSNLQVYFWPRLFSHFNYLLGVRPAARVAEPAQRSGFVWIESGYTWVLWTGGVPLLLALVWFLVAALRATRRRARESAGMAGVASAGSFTALWIIAILMVFDPHLTLRGTADLFFPLLAISLAPGLHADPAPTRARAWQFDRRGSLSTRPPMVGAGGGTVQPSELRQRGVGLFVKQVLDVGLATALLVLLTPVLALAAIAIKLSSPGPVLYRAARIGRHGRPFVALKFRSMYEDCDQRVHQQRVQESFQNQASVDGSHKLQDDPRVTPVGRILRRSSVDELPQLFNVLTGDMSLCGPRPEVEYAVELYEPRHWQRFDVLPGITGLWQVSGRSRLSQLEMLELDVRYARTWSPARDLWLIVKTPWVLLRGDGAR